MKKSGFTLIEFLVLVLIIGILAAVALPQYQKAVFKSKWTEAMMNLKTLKNAIEVCEMTNGRANSSNLSHPCFDVSNLDISLGEEDGGNFHGRNFIYHIDRGALSSDSTITAGAHPSFGENRGRYDLCLCIYDDGHFAMNQADCIDDSTPSFDYAKALNIQKDEDCFCC